jgi:hypothetical protein
VGRFKSPVIAAIASAGLTASVVGGVAIAQTDTTNVITGCIAANSGNVRIVASDEACKGNETRLTWNQRGPAGSDGNTVRNGTGAPPAMVGVDGDFYIDTGANTIYGPKANGAWPAAGVSLVGPAGPTGPQGPQGQQGPIGQTGPAGTARAWGEWGQVQGALINNPSPNVTVERTATGYYCVRVEGLDLARSLGIIATLHERSQWEGKTIGWSRVFPGRECPPPGITLAVRDAQGALTEGWFFFIVP